MKKYFVLLLTTLFMFGCASTTDVTSETVEKKLVVSGSKSELFNRSLDWAARYYNDSKSVIEVKDAGRGKVIGRGVLLIESSMGLRKDYYSYTLQIDVKDDKVRIKMNNIAPFAGLNGVSDPKYFIDDIKEKMNQTADEYLKAIQEQSDDTDW